MENTFNWEPALDAASPMKNTDNELPVMAYVPVQKFGTVYDPDKGFERGTLYPELDKPWLGGPIQ